MKPMILRIEIRHSHKRYMLTAVLGSILSADDQQFGLSKRYHQAVLTRLSCVKKDQQIQTGRAIRRKQNFVVVVSISNQY
jgi:hypothetical protein